MRQQQWTGPSDWSEYAIGAPRRLNGGSPDHDTAQQLLRIPPHSIEAESSVLGALLQDNTSREHLGGLAEGDFYRHEHRLIFGAIETLLAAGQPADVITVFGQLQAAGQADEVGGLPYLNSLAQYVPSAANIRRYAEIVREHAVRRRLIATSDEIAAAAFNPPDGKSLADVLQGAQQQLANIVSNAGRAPGVRPQVLDLAALAQRQAPPRSWFVAGWLHSGPSLCAAGGGVGKTLLAQQCATAGALGSNFIGTIEQPFRSLSWHCEDDADELWRRQQDISRNMQIALDAPGDKLVIQSRLGVDSMLMAPHRGELRLTPVFEELRQQVNDLGVDVLWLDNVAHLFGGDENVRGQVTAFINALAGLVGGRPFAVVMLAHTARQVGSEFAGSAAWENACRMRWYLGHRLPDQKEGSSGEDAPSDTRYLAKRKANYTARDYIRFTMRDGVLVPDQVPVDGMATSLMEERRAEQVLVAGFHTLRGNGLVPVHASNSGDYLPRLVAEKGLGSGFVKGDLARALNRLMGRGAFTVGVAGQYANRSAKQGLIWNTEAESERTK